MSVTIENWVAAQQQENGHGDHQRKFSIAVAPTGAVTIFCFYVRSRCCLALVLVHFCHFINGSHLGACLGLENFERHEV
jgi:hypothetical protein